MKRTLMQLGIGALEEMFANSKTDAKVLRQLENELQNRQVPRAVALLEEVQVAMKLGAPPALATTQEELVLVPPPAPLPVPPPPKEPAPPVVVRAPAVQVATVSGLQQSRPPAPQVRAAAAPMPAMTLEDACKLLKVTPTSPWQVVEQARRNLVELSHPSNAATLSAEQRDRILADARRVNAAYAALSTARDRSGTVSR